MCSLAFLQFISQISKPGNCNGLFYVLLFFFVLIRKKAQYENIDADIVQGEEEPQIAEEKGDNSCALMS